MTNEKWEFSSIQNKHETKLFDQPKRDLNLNHSTAARLTAARSPMTGKLRMLYKRTELVFQSMNANEDLHQFETK